ncbi:MAG: dsDNA nuclease domain-containing protein [Vitreimonas sp.]
MAALAKITPRETAGSETSARYDFQANVCIVKLLSLREAGEPYCAFFDYLDDLLILDSSTAPKFARFYQIKAKDPGSWTPASFCAQKGAESPRSIISRMYLNVESLKALTTSIGFISNAQFKFKLATDKESDSSASIITGAELHATVRDQLAAAVVKDFAEPLYEDWADLILLERFSHGVSAQEVFVKGCLVEHLEHADVGQQIPIPALYEVLFNAIRTRMSNVEKSQNITSLLDRKALTADEVNALFDKALANRPSIVRDWPTIAAELAATGTGSIKIIKLQTAAINYMRRCKVGAATEAAFSDATRAVMRREKDVLNSCESIGAAVTMLQTQMEGTMPDLSGVEREAAFLVEVYGAIHGSAE